MHSPPTCDLLRIDSALGRMFWGSRRHPPSALPDPLRVGEKHRRRPESIFQKRRPRAPRAPVPLQNHIEDGLGPFIARRSRSGPKFVVHSVRVPGGAAALPNERTRTARGTWQPAQRCALSSPPSRRGRTDPSSTGRTSRVHEWISCALQRSRSASDAISQSAQARLLRRKKSGHTCNICAARQQTAVRRRAASTSSKTLATARCRPAFRARARAYTARTRVHHTRALGREDAQLNV